jgi:hypothetical protein
MLLIVAGGVAGWAASDKDGTATAYHPLTGHAADIMDRRD